MHDTSGAYSNYRFPTPTGHRWPPAVRSCPSCREGMPAYYFDRDGGPCCDCGAAPRRVPWLSPINTRRALDRDGFYDEGGKRVGRNLKEFQADQRRFKGVGLTRRQRETGAAFYFDFERQVDTAEAAGISERSVQARLAGLRKKFKEATGMEVERAKSTAKLTQHLGGEAIDALMQDGSGRWRLPGLSAEIVTRLVGVKPNGDPIIAQGFRWNATSGGGWCDGDVKQFNRSSQRAREDPATRSTVSAAGDS